MPCHTEINFCLGCFRILTYVLRPPHPRPKQMNLLYFHWYIGKFWQIIVNFCQTTISECRPCQSVDLTLTTAIKQLSDSSCLKDISLFTKIQTYNSQEFCVSRVHYSFLVLIYIQKYTSIIK